MRRILFAFSCIALAASLLGAAAVIHQNGVQSFGIVSGLPDADLAPRPGIMAVNVALEQYDQTGLAQALNSLSAFQWLRQNFPWDEIEPQPGEYDWARWDGIVAQAETHQLSVIAVLSRSPAWARAPGTVGAAPPASPSDFANFAAAFAARYGNTIDVYQIWDEPNLGVGWGGQAPSAAGYAALLQGAYAAIHGADPTATVIAAALAPTTEAGPTNISDLLFMQQLYDLGARDYFDAAAGKPYGFDTGPDDRRADAALLNFSRFTLLRQIMEKNGDGKKLLWGANFGWNTQPSPWGHVTVEQQVTYSLAAYRRAITEWPWAGPLALENYQPGAHPSDNRPGDDARWGFALVNPTGEHSPLLQAIDAELDFNSVAVPGNHAAIASSVEYVGNWRFSDLGADIPEDFDNAQIQIAFQGTDLALRVRRANYRAYLYVTVDGQLANRLPRDERGAYLVLTSPDLNPEVVSLPVASGLSPNRTHVAVIRPERGWDQWAFVGFSVGQRFTTTDFIVALGLLTAVALLGLVGMRHFGRSLSWGTLGARARDAWTRLGLAGQVLLTALAGGLLYVTAWLTLGDELMSVSRRSGDAAPIVLTALTAGLFYFSPSVVLAVAALIALLGLFYLRLDIGLAFVAFSMPLYLAPRLLWQRGFSLVETATALALAAWLLQNFRPLAQKIKAHFLTRNSQHTGSRLSSLDLAMFAFVIAGGLSLLFAERQNVALYEFRTVILDPAIFYFLIRGAALERRAVWRIVDFFVLGAVLVAGFGLYQYATGTDLITAEGGVARIRSLYGSPNNLALYVGRVLPIAMAFLVLGRTRVRRALYAVAALILGVAVVLTFSKGALLLGIPAAMVVILVGWLGRRGWLVAGASAVAAVSAIPILSRMPRFGSLLNLQEGTSFFRVKLWTSAWRMFLDHPLFGVGPDNFLYAYRSWYILPEAWQEPNLSHPHNIALDYLSRVGLLGFAAGLWLHIGFWRVAVQAYQRLRASARDRDLLALCVGLMASVADMLAHGLVDHSFFLIDLAFAFCLAAALAQCLLKFAEAGAS